MASTYFAEIVGPHGVRYVNQTTLNECRLKGMKAIAKDFKTYGYFPTVNIFRVSDSKQQTQVGRIYGVRFNADKMLCGVYRDYVKHTEDKIVDIRRGNLDITLDEQASIYGGIREYL